MQKLYQNKLRTMKNIIVMLSLSILLLMSACSSSEQPEILGSATRGTEMELSDFGKVHNELMTDGKFFINQNKSKYSDEKLKSTLHTYVKRSSKLRVGANSLAQLSDVIEESMDAALWLDNNEDKDWLAPIESGRISGFLPTHLEHNVPGETIIDQLLNLKLITPKDAEFVKRIVNIVPSDSSSNKSVGAIKEELQLCKAEWETFYGEKCILNEANMISGIAIYIGIYSTEWWSEFYAESEKDGPQKIAPWLAHLIAKDVKGAVWGIASYMITSAVNGDDMTVKGAGGSALAGAVKGSLGGLAKYILR